MTRSQDGTARSPQPIREELPLPAVEGRGDIASQSQPVTAQTSLATSGAEPSAADTLRYAQAAAMQAAAFYGPPPGWAPLGDVYGCLMQIDNALCGLQRKPCEHVWSSDTEEHPYWHCMNCGVPKVMEAAPSASEPSDNEKRFYARLEIERVILRRLHEKRIDGYTLEMAEEIAALAHAETSERTDRTREDHEKSSPNPTGAGS